MRYLALNEVLELYRRNMGQTGGLVGIRDLNALESALAQPRATFGGVNLYPTAVDKASALGFSLIRIYEGLKTDVELPFTAVRHALAHSPEVLNRPKTVACLNKLFGSVRVDLDNRKHEKAFWQVFVDLLIAVDSLLGQLLINHASELRMPRTFRRPLTHSFAMYEMPVQYERWLTTASSRLPEAAWPRAADSQR